MKINKELINSLITNVSNEVDLTREQYEKLENIFNNVISTNQVKIVMEEQLVSFDIAKLAKEKGFYDSVNYCFAEINMKIKSEVNLLKYPPYGCSKDWKVMIYNGREQEIILRPTQSLLQKWLREYKDIHVFVIPTNRCIPFDRYKFEIYRPYGLIKRSYEDYETFEDALEQALIEALNLIK